MWFPKTLRVSRPGEGARGRWTSPAGYGFLFPLLLVPVLLSGCGGGGSGGINSTSTSDQGFRIVPAGGDVVPNFSDDGTPAGVTLTAQPNAVSEGVRVDLSHHTLTQDENTALTSQVGALVGSLAYSLVLTPRPSTFGGPVQMKIAVADPPKDTAIANTIKIYAYDAAAKAWVVLPGSFTPSTGSVSASVTGRMVFPSTPGALIYVVAYDVGPALPTGI